MMTNFIKPHIIQKIKLAPSTTGTYRFLDKNNKPIYIGKAINLANRLKSYLKPETTRMIKMMSVAEDVIWLECDTEVKALIFEATQIRAFQPKYNVLLKDDKAFFYLILNTGEKFPSVSIEKSLKTYRKTINGKGSERAMWFGPFLKYKNASIMIEILQKNFLLRDCSKNKFTLHTKQKRPCLLYHIHQCSAPCADKITSEQYKENVKKGIAFVKDDLSTIVGHMTKKMQIASKQMEYELAIRLRDTINDVTEAMEELKSANSVDYICSIDEMDFRICCIAFMRDKVIIKTITVFIEKIQEIELDTISMLMQFYCGTMPADRICVSKNFNKDQIHLFKIALESHLGNAILVETPQNVVDQKNISALENFAKDNIAQEIKSQNVRKNNLEELSKLLGFQHQIERIEVFDNSHLFGTNKVGAMIVVGKDGFLKSEYRKFNLDEVKYGKGDDYAMMESMLERRLRRLKEHITQDSTNEITKDESDKNKSLHQESDLEFIENSILNDNTGKSAECVNSKTSSLSKDKILHNDNTSAVQNNNKKIDSSMNFISTEVLHEEITDMSSNTTQKIMQKNINNATDLVPYYPDLLVIDGGFAHISSVKKAMEKTGVHIPFICVSKGVDRNAGNEIIWFENGSSIALPHTDDLLYYIQNIRDEAHRFAIETHRRKRITKLNTSVLDTIPNIGRARKLSLLQAFGSIENISQASISEVAMVKGMNTGLATEVIRVLQEKANN